MPNCLTPDDHATVSHPILDVRGCLMAVVLLVFAFFGSASTANAESYAGVTVGHLLWWADVDSTGKYHYIVRLSPGQHVIIVSTGYFRYSKDGLQDGYFRWHPGRNDRHAPCDIGRLKEKYAFVIDNKCWKPNYWVFSDHEFVWYWTVDISGTIKFEINDNKYHDNVGSLHVQVFAYPR